MNRASTILAALLLVVNTTSYSMANTPLTAEQKKTLAILETCNKNLSKDDVGQRKIIDGISAGFASNPDACKPKKDGQAVTAIKKLEKTSAEKNFLDKINEDALEKSVMAFAVTTITRGKTKSGQPYDLQNNYLKDFADLKMKICGLYHNSNTDRKDLCKNPKYDAIVTKVLRNLKTNPKVKSKPISQSEVQQIRTSIEKFNQACKKMHSSTQHAYSHSQSEEDAVKKLPLEERQAALQKLQSKNLSIAATQLNSSEAIQTRKLLEDLFNGPSADLFVVKEFRETINLRTPLSQNMTCDLKAPTLEQTRSAYGDLMQLELKSIALANEYQTKWADQSKIQDSIEQRLKHSPDSVIAVLMKNPSSECAKVVCDRTQAIYQDDQFDKNVDQALMVGGLVVGGALAATGLGAPVGAGLIAALGYADGAIIAASIAKSGHDYRKADQDLKGALAAGAGKQRSLQETAAVTDQYDQDKSTAIQNGLTNVAMPVAGAAIGKVGRAVNAKGALTVQDEIQTASKANESLARNLTKEEQKIVYEAHTIGRGQIGKSGAPAGKGNYTKEQLLKKSRKLSEGGFTQSEIRTLMKDGVVGDDLVEAIYKQNGDEFKKSVDSIIENRNQAYTKWKTSDSPADYKAYKKQEELLKEVSYVMNKKMNMNTAAVDEYIKRPTVLKEATVAAPVSNNQMQAASESALKVEKNVPAPKTHDLDKLESVRSSSYGKYGEYRQKEILDYHSANPAQKPSEQYLHELDNEIEDLKNFKNKYADLPQVDAEAIKNKIQSLEKFRNYYRQLVSK